MRHQNHGLRKRCDCGRRQWTKCDHPWHFAFKWRGVHHRYSLDRLVYPPVRTKEKAQAAVDRIRSEIRDGAFHAPAEPAAGGAVLAVLTLGQLADTYERSHVRVERPASEKRWRVQVNAILRRAVTLPTGEVRTLDKWAVSDVTTEAIKQFQELRRPAGVFAMNRDLGVLRAIFNWAMAEGLIEKTPFKRGSVSAIKRAPEAKRARRLEPGEADRLLAACGPHTRALVEAALETGCRRGELLTLQWSQVRLDGARPAIVLTAAKTKTKTLREVPISSRLRAILEMRQNGPDGKAHKSTAFVFGNDAGEAVKSFKRSWASAKLKAHGFTPAYVKGSARLTSASLEQLRSIDLHFHDLRREAGSRWLDAGVPLHTIQRWLGHTNIAQTSTYLAVTDTGSHEAMARFDAARVQRCATDSENPVPSGADESTTHDTSPNKSGGRLH